MIRFMRGPLSRRLLDRSVEILGRIPLPVFLWVAGAAIGTFVVLGVLQRTVYPLWRFANLDSELSVAKWFSSGLLWAAAGYWMLVAATGRSRKPWVGIWATILVLLAADEGNALHERLERWSGIDWQILYLPVIGLALAAWWGVVQRHRADSRPASLLMAGAVAWAAALILELIQNWGATPAPAWLYDPTMIAEEALEMIGATMLLLAGVLVLRSPSPRRRTE